MFTVLFALPVLTFAQTPGEHDTGDVQSAAYDEGSWGRDAGFGGTGFVFNGEQGLFVGNLFVGQSSTQISGLAYANPQEFTTVSPISSITPPNVDLDQGFESEYNDSSAPNPIGVSVVQRSYSGSMAPNTPFVIYDYYITNDSGSDLTGIYIGNFSDWDVNLAVDNQACYDAGSQLLYVWSETPGFSYFGVSVKGNTVSGWDADGSAGNPTDEIVWAGMTNGGGVCSTTPDDRRVTIGQGPYDIANGETINAVFCMVGGTDEADVIANAAVCNDVVIPVELVSFEATVSGSDVNLNWLTSSETNNAGFEVQLRGVGEYEAMGFVEGHGTTTIEQSYAYTISDLTPGIYTVRLKQIDFDGAFEYSPEIEIAVGVPGTHVLTQAYPNPFNPQASFSLSVAAAQHVEIALYNAIGQQVATLFTGQMEEGQARAFTIDGASLPSGSYYYRAIGQTFAETGRVTLLK